MSQETQTAMEATFHELDAEPTSGLLDNVLEKTAKQKLSSVSPIEFADSLGDSFAKCGWFGAQHPDEGKIIALTCQLEGLTPLEFHRMYHIIQSRPSMRSDYMLAEFRRRGGNHKVVRRDPGGASVLLKDSHGNEETFTLTWEDAKQEDFTRGRDGDVKDNYNYPRKRMQMLWARVISDGVRTMTPEIVAGMYTPEETSDFMEAPASPPAKQPEPEQKPEPPAEQPQPPAEAADEQPAVSSKQLLLGAKIDQLFKELNCSAEQMAAALEKRGVTNTAHLSEDDANNLIAILETKLAQSKN